MCYRLIGASCCNPGWWKRAAGQGGYGPDGWSAGDKTGTSIWPGMDSLYVDIGFATSLGDMNYTFAAYYRARTTHDGVDPASEDVLRQVGQVLAQFATS